MRILHVVATTQRRGAEVFASDLVGALNHDSVTQRVAVLRESNGLSVSFDAPLAVLQPSGWRLPGMRMTARTMLDLRKVVGDWSPDVVQAHGGEALKYSVAACAGARANIVYRKIGAAQTRITQGPRKFVYTALMRRTSAIVAVAEELNRETVELFKVPEDRVVTIPNAVDPRRLSPTQTREETRRELGIPSHAPMFMSVGALMPYKDPLDLLTVASGVLKERPDAVYIVVGEGPLRQEIEAEISRLGLDGRVLMLGVRSDMQNLLAASDVLVLTGGAEGMPGSVIEAGMAGLPVAGFESPGVSEIVVNGETGFLARPGDLKDLEACVLRLLADDVRTSMSNAARERCNAKFGIDPIARRYLELYQRVSGAA